MSEPTTESEPSLSGSDVRRRLGGYLWRQRASLIPGLLCALGVAGVQMGLGLLLGQFIKGLSSPATAPPGSFLVEILPDPTRLPASVVPLIPLVWVCIGVVALYGVQGLLKYGTSVLLGKAALRTGVDIRSDVYAHLHRQSLSFFHTRQTGALMSTLTSDVGRLQNAALLLKDVIAAPITAVVLLARLFVINPQFTLFSLVATPIMALVIGRLTRVLRNISRQSQEKQADIAAIMEEALGNPRVVQAFTAEERELAKFTRASDDSVAVQLRAIRRSARVGPLTDLIGSVAVALVLYVAGSLVTRGAMDAAKLGETIYLLNAVAQSVGGLGNLKSAWEEMMGASDRIFGEALSIEPEIFDVPGAVSLGPIDGRIAFENVRFSYLPDRPVLRGIDLIVEPGQVVALVGETGSGKSTLVDLVPRFYDPTDGVVRVDGHDLRSVALRSLRSQIAIVPQDTRLFSGTIRENIAYGRPDATVGQIEAAARAANAHDFVMASGDGYELRVGERGATLSGGQRQRIAIARALLADPRILILDEATSALDATTEALVQEALDRLMRGRTTLIIAHRLSTIVNADRIVVLKDGRIVESGDHGALMRDGGVYATLYETQRWSSEPGALALSEPVDA